MINKSFKELSFFAYSLFFHYVTINLGFSTIVWRRRPDLRWKLSRVQWNQMVVILLEGALELWKLDLSFCKLLLVLHQVAPSLLPWLDEDTAHLYDAWDFSHHNNLPVLVSYKSQVNPLYSDILLTLSYPVHWQLHLPAAAGTEGSR